MDFNQNYINFVENKYNIKLNNSKNNYVEIIGDFAYPYSIELNKNAELEDNIPTFIIEMNDNMACCYKYKLENRASNKAITSLHPYWKLPINLENDPHFQRFLNRGFQIKTTNIVKAKVNYHSFNPLPLLIEDLHKIKINNNKLFNNLYLYNKTFKTVIFCGIVIKIRMKYFNIDEPTLNATYNVDDGTSNIIMHFKHRTKEKLEDLDNIEKLDSNITCLLEDWNSRNKSDYDLNVYKSMKIIMDKIKNREKSINDAIKSGEKILIIGVPFRNKRTNKINIKGLHYEYISNNYLRNDSEVFWKNYIINLYKNNYFKYTIDGEKL